MIAQIDKKMSEQINAIIHNKDFQQLESAWRGLHYLVQNTETSANLKIRVLNVAKRELSKDLAKAVEFDQSQIFKTIYESEFGTRVFRDGRPIEVPAGNRRGERLRPGDEIYLGRACLRFER